MKYYMCMPNFRRIYNIYGLKRTKNLLNMIEEIRYMCYLASYFEQGCVPITQMITKCDQKMIQILDKVIKKMSNFYSFTKEMSVFYNVVIRLHYQIQCRVFQLFCQQHELFYNIIGYENDKPDIAFKEIVMKRCMDWGVYSHRVNYNEMKNPIVVERLLDILFVKDEDVLKKTQYGIAIYDLGEYPVTFVSKSEMESFIKHFVESGVAFNITDDVWDELYAF